MRYSFADLDRNDLEFWGRTCSELHAILLKEGCCIGWSVYAVNLLLAWAEEAVFHLRAKKYTNDIFVNICIASAKGDNVQFITGGAIKLDPNIYWTAW